MSKVIFTVGISGAGKSTWSKQFVLDNKNYVRVSRDDLRLMLCSNNTDYYKRKDVHILEGLVTEAVQKSISTALDLGYNVIVDQNNYNISHINSLLAYIERNHSKVEYYYKRFEIPLKTAQQRVYIRDYFYNSDDDEYIDYHAQPEVEYIEKMYDKIENTFKLLEKHELLTAYD